MSASVAHEDGVSGGAGGTLLGPDEPWEGSSAGVWASLWDVPRLEIHDRLPSTQDRARSLLGHGCPPFTMVIADEQTAGRGRSGARWVSEAGAGLWCSLVLPGPAAPYLPLLVGLAVVHAVERILPSAPPSRIEWPNDVTIGDRKVAGVLCEASGSGVVAGVGVNTRAPRDGFPAELGARAGALDAWDPDAGAARPRLVGALVQELRSLLPEAVGRTMPPRLLAALRARDALRDRPVLTEQEGPGRALGITVYGTLRMERDDGRLVEIRSGRVRPLPRPASQD